MKETWEKFQETEEEKKKIWEKWKKTGENKMNRETEY